MLKLNVVYDTTSGECIVDSRLGLQYVLVLQELEALLQNTEDTLDILSNWFQFGTKFHDCRTRYRILLGVDKDRPTMVPPVANEVDTSMKLTGTIRTCRTPSLGVQPTIPFQQVHHSLVGSDNVFVVSGARVADRNRLNKFSTIANHFISNRTKSLLAFKHVFMHCGASIPHNMDAVHACNTAGKTPGCILSNHMSVLVVVPRHVDILMLDRVHIGNPL